MGCVIPGDEAGGVGSVFRRPPMTDPTERWAARPASTAARTRCDCSAAEGEREKFEVAENNDDDLVATTFF